MHDACVRRVREGVGDAVTYKAAERTAAHATTEEVSNGKLFREASRERERVCEDVQAYALYDVRACERCAQACAVYTNARAFVALAFAAAFPA